MKILLQNIKTFFIMFRQLMAILARKQRRQCMLLLFGVFVCAMLETLGVGAVIPFVLVLFSPEEMMENRYIKMLSDMFGVQTYLGLLILTAIIIVAVYIIKNGSLILFQYYQGRIHNEIEKELMTKQFRMFMLRPYAYYLNVNTADVMRGLNSDITQVVQCVDGFTGLASEGVTLLMIGAFIIVMDPFIAICLVGTAALVAFTFLYGFKKKTSYFGNECREIFLRRNKIILESVGGYKEISIYQKKQFFVDEYEEVNERASKLNTQYLLIMKIPSRAIETVFITCLLLLACIKIGTGGNNGEFVSLIGAMAVAAIRILPSISSISGYMNTLIYNRLGLEGAYNNIDAVKKEKELYEKLTKKSFDAEKVEFTDKVSLRDLTFRYDNTDNDILKDINVDIYKNESVAFIGESGAGKSTLLDVLLGLLKPQCGGVYMDGNNIEDIPFAWSDIVGYVPQNVYLLDDTVRHNIAFGIKDKDIDDVKIWEALKEAQLDEFVRNLPNGLDTTVGERGVRFSGGQRQRVAIARALYHDPQILVLDEATSALDNETEKEVMKAIDNFHGRLTIIIVAHRLTTIEKCDRIFVVKDSKVIKKD